jgi:caa(3)-type oxidase subunit IV
MKASRELSSSQRRFITARRSYLFTWIALLALLAASATSAHFHLGIGNLIAGVGIALLKAALVGWIFMSMNEAPGLARAAAATGMALLCVLAGLSLVDFLPRHDETSAYQQPAAVPPAITQDHRFCRDKVVGHNRAHGTAARPTCELDLTRGHQAFAFPTGDHAGVRALGRGLPADSGTWRR